MYVGHRMRGRGTETGAQRPQARVTQISQKLEPTKVASRLGVD